MPTRTSVRLCVRISLILLLTALALFGRAVTANADILRGRAVDPQARAIAGANVAVLQGPTVILCAKTRADGQFGPFDLPPGEYDVIVYADGLQSPVKHVKLNAQSATAVDIALDLRAVHDSIVVSAAQVEMPLSRVTDSVTVIDRAEITQRQAEAVFEMLRTVPGFGVVNAGGRGSVTSIFPRGGESDYTLVLVDGIPQNVFGGGFDAAHLATADIEQIEVVRGPQSALFGGGAIGGVVHVITRAGGPFGLSAMTETGSYGTTRGGASVTGSRGAWGWGGGFDSLMTDGDTRERANLGGQRVANDDYKRHQGSGSLTWLARPGRTVRIDARASHDERGAPGAYGSDPIGAYSGLNLVSRGFNTTRELGASGTFKTGSTLRHHWQFTIADFNNLFRSPKFDDPTVISDSNTDARRVTARYQVDTALSKVPLSAGAEFLSEREDNSFIKGQSSQLIPVERRLAGFFAEARPTMGDHASINFGIRAERLERVALEADNPAGFQPRPAFASGVVWSVNPKISGAWMIRAADNTNGTWTKLRFGAGTGIKPPTAFEIAFTDNPDLKPERNRSWDVGIQQGLAKSTLVADLTWFSNRYTDLIVAVGSQFSGASKYRTDNIANARARGLEVGVTWRGRAGISARGAWTRLDTEVLDLDSLPGKAPSPFHVGDPLLRRPKNQGSLSIGWTHARAGAFVEINGRGEFLDTEPNFGSFGGLFTTPGYATVTLGASVRAIRHVEIFGRVSNLLDRQYEEVLGFPALGRAASIGVRIATGR